MVKRNKNGFLTGRMGMEVYRELDGKQIVQSMPMRIKDAKTPAQEAQRARMRSLLVAYRYLKPALPGCFEGGLKGRMMYAEFAHFNLMLNLPGLTKRDYMGPLNGPDLYPYVVSNGSLPPLNVRMEEGRLRFDMLQEEWKPEDVLRCIHLDCVKTRADSDWFYIQCRFEDEVVYCPMTRVVESAPLLPGAHTYVHLRPAGDKSLASTQSLLLL